MAVVVQEDVRYRRFNGYLDPRYPQGTWFCKAAIVGDATGGILSIDFVFSPFSFPTLNSRMFSLERLSIDQLDNTDRTYHVTTANFTGEPLSFTHDFAVEVRGLLAGGGAMDLRDLAGLPVFLGSQREFGTTMLISAAIANVNLLQFNWEAEGYWWSPRSVLADGGPQRPPTGLYRA